MRSQGTSGQLTTGLLYGSRISLRYFAFSAISAILTQKAQRYAEHAEKNFKRGQALPERRLMPDGQTQVVLRRV